MGVKRKTWMGGSGELAGNKLTDPKTKEPFVGIGNYLLAIIDTGRTCGFLR